MNEIERDVSDLLEKYTLKQILETIAFWMPDEEKKVRP